MFKVIIDDVKRFPTNDSVANQTAFNHIGDVRVGAFQFIQCFRVPSRRGRGGGGGGGRRSRKRRSRIDGRVGGVSSECGRRWRQ